MKFRNQLIILLIISLITRFWNFGEFNRLVFDEAHYVKFADHYLRGKDFFQVHPPVAQYLTAISIMIGKIIPFFPNNTNYINRDAGFTYSVLGYRWLNCLFGSLLPIITSLLVYEIKPCKRIATLTGIFIVLDGLFLTESRYALNNIYLVFFGILSQLLIIKGIKNNDSITRILGSISLGGCIGTKISGLGYMGGTWIYLKISDQLKKKISDGKLIDTLLTIPLLTYLAIWIPHQIMIKSSDFYQTHILSLKFHKEAAEINHPSNSKWFQWPFLYKPIPFVSEQANGLYRYVLSFPNPIIGYGSTISVVILASRKYLDQIDKSYREIINFCLINYAANWIPWSLVKRGIFLYHYMPAYIYGMMALATIISIIDDKVPKAAIAFTTVTIVGFLFYKAIYYGLPINYQEFSKLILFTKWI
jgi:dolichyl-phosphate-mannose--protein O-mannosyl transferase